MRTFARLAIACAGIYAFGCGAAPLAACDGEPGMAGMRERLVTLHDEMGRITYVTDRTQRRVLMDLHMKHMNECLRELRTRDLGAECRMDIMTSVLEEMVHHQQALGEPGSR